MTFRLYRGLVWCLPIGVFCMGFLGFLLVGFVAGGYTVDCYLWFCLLL